MGRFNSIVFNAREMGNSAKGVVAFLPKGLRAHAWLIPLIMLAAVDLIIRSDKLVNWGLRDYGFYLGSMVYLFCWLVLLRALFLNLTKHSTVLPWGMLAILTLISTLINVFHFRHYLYFGIHPTSFNIGYLLVEPRDGLSILRDEWTWFTNVQLVGALGLFLTLWWVSLKSLRPIPATAKGGLRWKMASALFGVLVLSGVFHNNVILNQGSFLPSVNLAFTTTKVVQVFLKEEGQVRRLQVGNRVKLPRRKGALPVNVLLIITESQRASAMGIYGGEAKNTPRQAAFLQENPKKVFRFEKAYANAVITSSSLPSIMTGVHPSDDATILHRMPLVYEYAKVYPKVRTFLLAAQSYGTANYRFFFQSTDLDRMWYQEISEFPVYNNLGMDDRHLTDAFVEEMSALPPDQRFFGVLHYNTSHYPYKVPPEFVKWGKKDYWQRYLNSIGYQDYQIGRVMDLLKSRGKLENTVVILTSDHGEGFGEHKLSGHGPFFYEEAARIPMWIYLPPKLAEKYGEILRENQKINVFNTDLAPTLLELIGLSDQQEQTPVLASLAGKSLLRSLRPNRLVLLQNGPQRKMVKQGFAVVSDNERLLYLDNGGRPRLEYYDVAKDPEQRNNLINELSPERYSQLMEIIGNYPRLVPLIDPALLRRNALVAQKAVTP